MIDIQSALLGGVAFVVVLYLGYRALLAFTSFGDDPQDTESTEDRLSMADERHQRVGFRHRVSRQTPMTKAFIGAGAVFLAYLAIAIYQIAATGAPSEAVYAEYLEYAVFGMVCVGGGIWFKAKQDAKAGELQIMEERDSGNRRRTVKFDRSGVRYTDNDTTLVPQLKDRQLFGLFWRPKLIGDEPELRDSDHRLPDDLVMWEIPDDDSAVWDERAGEVTIRAKRVRTVENPDQPADYQIVPSERKSKSEIQDLKNEKQEIKEDLKHERVLNAMYSEKLEEIEQILENEEDAGMRRVRRVKEVLEPDRNQPVANGQQPQQTGQQTSYQSPASND